MKFQIRLIAALLSLLLLATVVPLAQMLGPGVVTLAQAASDGKYLAYYADVIADYQTAIENNFYRDGDRFKNNLKYVGPAFLEKKYYNTCDDVFYAFYDINKNGFPELIVGEKSEGRKDGWELYGVYAFTDKVKLADKEMGFWGYRSHATIHKNGTIAVSTYGGINDYYWRFFKLKKDDTPKLKDALHLGIIGEGEKHYFRENNTYGETEDETEITKKEFDGRCKELTGQKNKDKLKTDVKLTWKRINDLPEIEGLKKPTDLKITAANSTTLKLVWDKVKGAKGYVVYRYNTSTKKYIKLAKTSWTSVKLTDLKPETTYHLAVRAFSKPAGKVIYSKYSKQLTATTTS